LPHLGSTFTSAMMSPYISSNYTAQDFLIPYVQKNWQAGCAELSNSTDAAKSGGTKANIMCKSLYIYVLLGILLVLL